MNELGVGVIGAGVMGSAHVRTIAASVPGARVVAVFDADAARASAVAADVGGVAADTADELINAPDVDAVIIAAPDPLHEGLTLACVEAGKPTLCEKPLAVTSEGTRRIVDAEIAGGRRLIQVGFMRRFDAGFVQLRRAIEAGAVGRPRVLHCLHRNAQAHPSATSEGVVSNSMIHELDHVPWLLGEPLTAITVIGARPGADADALIDTQVAVLETASGAVATVEVSINAGYGYDVQCEVLGDLGTLRLTPPYGLMVRRDGVDGVQVDSDFVARFEDAYRIELQAWVGSVATGVPAGPSAWDGHVATGAAAAGVESLRGAGRVEIHVEELPKFYR